ncbi:hypothetical protein ACFWY9_28605 [Amycolatopsis sp. NPDC059027]|uniref:hypothetical protein n=1 Tax=Amycolatopsis sp. NPDC059027 TaxID=3346709 RepID=UPI0036722DA8
MPVKDVTLFRGEEGPVVTGDPIEVAKLKARGWTEIRPVPSAPEPKSNTKPPAADAAKAAESK